MPLFFSIKLLDRYYWQWSNEGVLLKVTWALGISCLIPSHMVTIWCFMQNCRIDMNGNNSQGSVFLKKYRACLVA